MPQHPPVTLEEVQDALYACLAEGLNPSGDRLLERIGHGSKGTILKHRDQVLEAMRGHLRGHVLPPTMPETLAEPLQAFWRAARDAADACLAEERAALHAQMDDMKRAGEALQQRTKQAEQARDQANAVAEERSRAIDALRVEQEQLQQALKDAQHAHELALEKAQALHQAERDGLRQQVEQSRASLEEMRIDQARDREYWEGQEKHFFNKTKEAQDERERFKERLRACEQRAQLEQERLLKGIQENQKIVQRLEARESVIEEELQQLRDRLELAQKSAMEQQVRAEHCESLLNAERESTRQLKAKDQELSAAYDELARAHAELEKELAAARV